MALYRTLYVSFALIIFASCSVLKTEHHITLDHNITVKIEKEVNDFLDELYADEE